MRILHSISLISLCLLFASCNLIDFSEKCSYHGDVQVRFDWQSLPAGSTPPPEMTTGFYRSGILQRTYNLRGDSLLKDIPSGQYNVLSYNPCQGVSIADGKAGLPVTVAEGKEYTVQAPLLYVAKTDRIVEPFETGLCLLSPKGCTRQIDIDFVVVKENIDNTVTGMTGELDGVSTGYDLSGMVPDTRTATLPFTTAQKQAGKFTASLDVFGVNGTGNTLTVLPVLSDGTTLKQTLDLSSVLRGFTAPAIHLTVEIHLTGLGMTINLTDWYYVNQGNLVI